MRTQNNFPCPICGAEMLWVNGDSMNLQNGITIFCDAPDCPTHENVFGHGDNIKKAYEAACEKFKKSKN